MALLWIHLSNDVHCAVRRYQAAHLVVPGEFSKIVCFAFQATVNQAILILDDESLHSPVGLQDFSGACSGNVPDLVGSCLPTERNLIWLQSVINLELAGSDHGGRSRVYQRLQATALLWPKC